MKPSTLKTGMSVYLRTRNGQLLVATVALRDHGNFGRVPRTELHVPTYAGLLSPQDPGLVTLTEAEVRSNLTRIRPDVCAAR